MKKILLIAVLLVLILVSSPHVYAMSCGFENPTTLTGGTIGNQTVLNASFADANGTAIRIAFFLTSAAQSRNTTASAAQNVSNLSGAALMAPRSVNVSFPDAAVFDEAPDYTLSCSCYNSTDTQACNATRTGITLDRKSPNQPTGITFTNPLKDGNTITATIDRDNANSCFVRFGSVNAPRKSMTLSGSTCTFTARRNNPPNSDYPSFIESSDGTNGTLSAMLNIIIRATQSDGGGLFGGTVVMPEKKQGSQSIVGGQNQNPFAPKKKNDGWAIWIVAGFFAFLLFKGKNK